MDYFLRGGREEQPVESKESTMADERDLLAKENFNQTSPSKLGLSHSMRHIAKNRGRPPRPSVTGATNNNSESVKFPRYQMATDSYLQKLEGDIQRFSRFYGGTPAANINSITEDVVTTHLPSIRDRRSQHQRDSSLPNRLDSSTTAQGNNVQVTKSSLPGSVQAENGINNTSTTARRGRIPVLKKASWMFMAPRNKSLEPKDDLVDIPHSHHPKKDRNQQKQSSQSPPIPPQTANAAIQQVRTTQQSATTDTRANTKKLRT